MCCVSFLWKINNPFWGVIVFPKKSHFSSDVKQKHTFYLRESTEKIAKVIILFNQQPATCNLQHTTHNTQHTTHYTLHTTHYTLLTAHCTLHTTNNKQQTPGRGSSGYRGLQDFFPDQGSAASSSVMPDGSPGRSVRSWAPQLIHAERSSNGSCRVV